jgi:hypothetical protein
MVQHERLSPLCGGDAWAASMTRQHNSKTTKETLAVPQLDAASSATRWKRPVRERELKERSNEAVRK